jgi:hypothetical protein
MHQALAASYIGHFSSGTENICIHWSSTDALALQHLPLQLQHPAAARLILLREPIFNVNTPHHVFLTSSMESEIAPNSKAVQIESIG